MKTARQTHDRSGPPSPVISTLHYRLIPQSIFDRIRDLKDSEDKRDKRNYDFENYRLGFDLKWPPRSQLRFSSTESVHSSI